MINEKNYLFFRFPFFALKTDMEWTEDTLIPTLVEVLDSCPMDIFFFFFFFFFFWPVSSTDNTCQYICVAILSSFTAFFLFF